MTVRDGSELGKLNFSGREKRRFCTVMNVEKPGCKFSDRTSGLRDSK